MLLAIELKEKMDVNGRDVRIIIGSVGNVPKTFVSRLNVLAISEKDWDDDCLWGYCEICQGLEETYSH